LSSTIATDIFILQRWNKIWYFTIPQRGNTG
jgi:hypothetical protein